MEQVSSCFVFGQPLKVNKLFPLGLVKNLFIRSTSFFHVYRVTEDMSSCHLNLGQFLCWLTPTPKFQVLLYVSYWHVSPISA